jgi:FkbM family methyltransferase
MDPGDAKGWMEPTQFDLVSEWCQTPPNTSSVLSILKPLRFSVLNWSEATSPGDVFVDIGANIGYYALLAKQRVGPQDRVLAFEPHPKTASRLKKNVERSGSLDIELFEGALSNQSGEMTLFSSLRASHGDTSLQNQGWPDAVSVRVQARKLDDILPSDIWSIACVEADVEGAEVLVFE